MMCNSRSINFKATTLQSNFITPGVELECVTKTWVREGEMVALEQLPPPPGFYCPSSIPDRGVAVFIQESGVFLL